MKGMIVVSILLINCFHWIGFHMTNQLLESGYKVDGIDQNSSHQQEQLSMFVGRNSSFSLLDKQNLNEYRYSIIVGSYSHIEQIQANHTLQMTGSSDTNNQRNQAVIEIEMPLLFGEWMPMTEKGIYYRQQFIPFDSPRFLLNAVYIKDFTNSLLQWMESHHLSHVKKVKTTRSNDADLKLENTIYLRDNRPIHKQIEHVIDHYKRFKQFYE